MEFASAEADADARLLPLRGSAASRIRWLCQDAVEKVKEITLGNFPVLGPRMAALRVAFLNRRGGGAVDHHKWWV
eukprot:7351433-Pyramimonas_sp.AAC.1